MILDELALTFVPELGSRGVAHLMEIYSSAEEVYAQKEHNLILCAELRKDIAARIVQKAGYAEAEREMRYCEAKGIKVTSFNDADYPPLLREASDRPHVVYSMGDIEALQSQYILSVVGTRRISSYGESVCAKFIPELAEMFPDLVVVSGLAFGVDAAAHRAALAAGVRTVGVIANRLPEVIPAQHRNLAKDMLDNGGAIITELHSQTKQNGSFYIPRNRIIAGVAGVCAELGANIVDISQSVLQEYFAMIMLADIDKLGVDFAQFVDTLEAFGTQKGLTIHAMHEDIFNTMHHI